MLHRFSTLVRCHFLVYAYITIRDRVKMADWKWYLLSREHLSFYLWGLSSLSEIHRYSGIASLDNKIIADQQPTLFTGKLTIVACVIRCALTQHCVTVFYLSSSCKGYPTVFSSTSPGLTTLTGAHYFVSETANLTSEVVYEATMHKYWEYPGYINVVGHF